MPFANINQIKVYYEMQGAGEPLVLIAGYTCDHSFWSLMQEELANKFKILIFDNLAIGQTKDKNTQFSLENQADIIYGLIKHLNLGKVNILGHSMGGAIAQIFAHKYPNEVKKLIIVNSVAEFNFRMLHAFKHLLNFRKQNESAFDVLFDLSIPWLFSSAFLANKTKISDFKKSILENQFPQSVLDQERQYNNLPKFNSKPWLKEIKNPTLVIAGTEDLVALPEEGKYLASKIPGAKYAELPTGHVSPLEQPKLLNKLIIDFLDS